MTQQLHGTLSGQSSIRGALSGESNLTGTLSAKVFHLTGTLSGHSSIRGALSGASQISGSLSVPLGSGDQPYWGRIKGNLANQLDLAQALDAKSDVGHNHNNLYSLLSHNHDQRYSRLNHTHDGVYSPVGHNHNSLYSLLDHDHDGVYSPAGHNHNGLYSPLNHDHDDAYASKTHTHDYSDIYAAKNHDHDDAYASKTHTHDYSDIFAAKNHNHDDTYAAKSHTHDYSDIFAAKNHDHNDLYALLNHTHDGLYSPLNHNHDDLYALLNHTHDYSDTYSAKSHNHNDLYSLLNHDHDSSYSAINHTHDYSDTYAAKNHDHNDLYSLLSHNHDSSYSAVGHTHDDRYYTESEVNTLLNGKLSLTGGSLTGYLSLAANNGDIRLYDSRMGASSDADNTTTQWLNQIRFFDKENVERSQIRQVDNTNGQGLQIETRRMISGSWVYNGIQLRIKQDGTQFVSVNNSAVWRSALEVLSLSGGTLTGNLSLKHDGIDTGASSISATSERTLAFRDKNNLIGGYLTLYQTTDGRQLFGVICRRTINSTTYDNNIYLRIENDGTKSVQLGAPAAWRSAMGAMNDVKVKSLNATMAADASSVNITASPDSGYTFVCWVGFTPSGFGGVFHCTSFSTAATTLWQDYGTTTSNRTVACFFLEKK